MNCRPFPETIERKRELHAAILREGGGPLMSEVAQLRAQWPGAALTYIKAGNLEVGVVPRDGYVITPNAEVERLRRKLTPTIDEIASDKLRKKK